METTIKTEEQKKEYNQVLDNYNDEYWAKKYGVSAEELKQNSTNVAITAKIIEATTRKNAFAL
ncbi:hypothetical protein HDF24_18815 [Mucilaginibacter sp. X4EP1]|uniref:hypothetical protein n=1 Tax=Mucilaginibacter sp. X4EP1 TaxID=2723092 RepID=UPI00216A1521|nr:hypothetical protein [Mucilaginibacter sp. X4EP1]MCS3813374.1 hypothetical protein [Mucilaginibacter sp. X4EP1]